MGLHLCIVYGLEVRSRLMLMLIYGVATPIPGLDVSSTGYSLLSYQFDSYMRWKAFTTHNSVPEYLYTKYEVLQQKCMV